jgi:hypothetical protein
MINSMKLIIHNKNRINRNQLFNMMKNKIMINILIKIDNFLLNHKIIIFIKKK